MRGQNRFRHIRAAYRSGLEATLAAALATAGVDATFEQHRIPYTQPQKARTYTPDFVLPNGIVIESKGLLTQEDRAKMAWVKEQHPALDIRFVFSNAKAKMRKGSPTTYADWADKAGFPWAHKAIPSEWLREPVQSVALKAIVTFAKAK